MELVGSVRIFGDTPDDRYERLYLKTISDGSILSVSREILVRIMSVLSISNQNSSDIMGCETVLENAPLIEIKIESIPGIFVSLVLYPEDYMRPIPGTDRCKLLIGVSHRRVILLNPLLIDGVNIRINRWSLESGGSIQFCDTLL